MSGGWSGGGLFFGRMYEDWTVDAEALPREGRIFCIASAGDTAFALAARGADVTAVDVNPAQVAYVRERLAGAPPRAGRAERLLAGLRRLGVLAGWSKRARRGFCALDDPEEQTTFWRERLDTARFRAALAVALAPAALRGAYAPELVRALPPRFDRVLRRRLARGFARHPNRANAYVRALILGEAEQPEPAQVTVVCADAAEFLERCEAATFDGFSLSNVLDGASPAYAERLLLAVRRAAAPGAALVLRSFREPAAAEDAERAARDRAPLWGSIRVERL